MDTKLQAFTEDRNRKQDEARAKKEAAEKNKMLRDAKGTAEEAERDLKRYQNNLKYLKSAQTRIKEDDEEGRLANEGKIASV